MILYELEINENELSGVNYVAIVDRPAIKDDFIAFNEVKQMFQIQDEEKRIVSGYLMIADRKIVREDEERGLHEVVFRAKTIRDIQLKFMSYNRNRNTNLMHNSKLQMDDVIIFEHIIIDNDIVKKAPIQFDEVPNGSWWVSMYIPLEQQELWEKIKRGEFKGFSVEGFFVYPRVLSDDEVKLNELIEILKNN